MAAPFSRTSPPSVDRLALVDAACDRFEAALRRGERLPIEALVAELPADVREEATAELAAIAEALLGDEAATLTAALHLRCPHCDGGVAVVAEESLDAITCGTCGSVFGLVGADGEESDTPRSVGRFLLREKLGQGGFGAVWRAYDPELDRDVAVKLPRRGTLSRPEIEFFFREARAAAQLAHPNIVPVYEVGRDGDAVYIVSELVPGDSLQAKLKQAKPGPRQTARLLATIADALHAAHERGVVHRDLKPGNVMLSSQDTDGAEGPAWGEPRLMDFGLAKRASGEITMTVEGQVLGTPAYMSPEQAGGETEWTDRRTDVYSLGVMLFEMLTGELPFRGPASSQIEQRRTDDPPSPKRLAPHTPADLATVCLKCMERTPGRRYPTAGAVADELRRWLAHEPIVARPLSPWGRAARWARRRPASAIALTLAAVLAIAGPIAAVVLASQRSQLADRLAERNEYVRRGEQAIDRLTVENERLLRGEVGRQPRRLADLLPPKRRAMVEAYLTQQSDWVSAVTSGGASAEDRLALALLLMATDDLARGAPLLLAVERELHEQVATDEADTATLRAHAVAAEWAGRWLDQLDADTTSELFARALDSRHRLIERGDPIHDSLAWLDVLGAASSGAALPADRTLLDTTTQLQELPAQIAAEPGGPLRHASLLLNLDATE
ncbi:MAG: serine/threonine-protein kinase [Planctomycetota bacterium]